MGLAPLIVVCKLLAMRRHDEHWNAAARLLAKLFAVNFAFGVVTGIPMEFQFGTNWARFSRFAGGVIGQTLAMEGMFAFFLESSFLGLFLFGEKRLSPRAHLASALAVFASLWQLFPSGDRQGQLVATNQPATLAAMEGLFATRPGAPLVLIGQPNTDERRIDNTLEIPAVLSMLTHQRWNASVTGLDQ